MIGTFRLVMAMIVAAHHSALWPWGLRWGLPCVNAFFMISGYCVSALAKRHFRVGADQTAGHAWAEAWDFWRDRLLRLFPQYLFWLATSAVVILVFHRHWMFQTGKPDWINILCNVTVFPVSFWMYIPSLASLFFVPQAWSLSVELMFCTVFPAVQRWPAVGWLLTIGGLAVLVLGTVGVLTPAEYFNYRLPPAAFPFFMLGRALYRRDRVMQAAIVGVISADILLVWFLGRMGVGYNLEILWGAMLGYLVLCLTTRLRPRRWDRLIGNFSYGAYLSHIVLLALLLPANFSVLSLAAIVTTGAVLAGGLSFMFIEAPINRFRYRLRSVAGQPLQTYGSATLRPIDVVTRGTG